MLNEEQKTKLGLKEVKAYIEDKEQKANKSAERKRRHRNKLKEEGKGQVNLVVRNEYKGIMRDIAKIMERGGVRAKIIKMLVEMHH